MLRSQYQSQEEGTRDATEGETSGRPQRGQRDGGRFVRAADRDPNDISLTEYLDAVMLLANIAKDTGYQPSQVRVTPASQKLMFPERRRLVIQSSCSCSTQAELCVCTAMCELVVNAKVTCQFVYCVNGARRVLSMPCSRVWRGGWGASLWTWPHVCCGQSATSQPARVSRGLASCLTALHAETGTMTFTARLPAD